MMSGLGGMVAQGMAFGTGSAIAHQVRLAMGVAWERRRQGLLPWQIVLCCREEGIKG